MSIEIISPRMGFAIIFFLSLSTNSVEAQYRSHHRSSSYHRHATANIQAQKKQMINMLQSQVSVANQVLANVESKSAISQSMAIEAMSKLNHVRQEIETANAEVHNAFEEVQMIEADILAEQADNSDFADATKAVGLCNQEVHRVFHRLAHTLDDERISTDDARFVEMSRLPESQRITIKSDPEYKFVTEQLSKAEQHLVDVRKKLFEGSKEWRDAKRALDKARQDAREEMAKTKPATMATAHQNQESQQLRNVIENAKLIVAQGEIRLRQLGAKPLASKYSNR